MSTSITIPDPGLAREKALAFAARFRAADCLEEKIACLLLLELIV
jgi:hypothetical protein